MLVRSAANGAAAEYEDGEDDPGWGGRSIDVHDPGLEIFVGSVTVQSIFISYMVSFRGVLLLLMLSHAHAAVSPQLTVSYEESGSYTVSVDGTTWLTSGPTRLHGTSLSPLGTHFSESGQDALGTYTVRRNSTLPWNPGLNPTMYKPIAHDCCVAQR